MEHIHNHAHPHSHEDGHTHVHPHAHSDGAASLTETKALLAYMLHHNEHHAEELAELLDSLPKNAQKKLTLAIGSFEAANVQLQEVLDCLE